MKLFDLLELFTTQFYLRWSESWEEFKIDTPELTASKNEN